MRPPQTIPRYRKDTMLIQSSVKINYSMLCLLQYSFAILVILLHGRRIFAPEPLHFIQKRLFSRMVVPFFIASSRFLLTERLTHQTTNLKTYLKKQVTPTLTSLCSIFLMPSDILDKTTSTLPSCP